ncbi:DUF4760 domain-containing protein [Novosphingobium sp. HII-3]|uniref:DUF4760 domain-containing protein n=1 Tax=Novosphingobium sp. HII-3 TaxID=2075565 RepID=UPI000CDB6E7B|nr:DUF4760 domain-containing protein [Novosphingobium sp. HII-3]
MLEFLKSLKDVAPAVGAATAIITAIVALLVFRHTRIANRRRATLDMVMKTLMDSFAQERYGSFKKIIRKDKDPENPFKLASLLDATDQNHTDRELVLHQLNIYEMTSLGIRRKLFDEEFYKRWFHNQFMTDFENSRDFIQGAQARKGSVYCEFAALYSRWEKSGHPVSSPGRIKMALWSLSGKFDKVDQAREWTKAR